MKGEAHMSQVLDDNRNVVVATQAILYALEGDDFIQTAQTAPAARATEVPK